MSPEQNSEQQAEHRADQELIAGALAGDPAELAELARRFCLLPRLLSQWNTQRDEPLVEEDLIERARRGVVSLWQSVPSYTDAESFDAWLARQSAGCMDLDVPGEAPDVLEAALASSAAHGDAETRDALALYRAEEALDRTPSAEQRPIWGFIGVLGLIAVFLTLSPLSPWQWQPSADQPATAETAETTEVAPTPEPIALIAPLGRVTEASIFEWSGPEDQAYTLVIEHADGREFSQASELTGLSHTRSESLPTGSYHWRVLPGGLDASLSPSAWSEIVVASPDGN